MFSTTYPQLVHILMNKLSTEPPTAYEQKLASPLISTTKIKRFTFCKLVIHKKTVLPPTQASKPLEIKIIHHLQSQPAYLVMARIIVDLTEWWRMLISSQTYPPSVVTSLW